MIHDKYQDQFYRLNVRIQVKFFIFSPWTNYLQKQEYDPVTLSYHHTVFVPRDTGGGVTMVAKSSSSDRGLFLAQSVPHHQLQVDTSRLFDPSYTC